MLSGHRLSCEFDCDNLEADVGKSFDCDHFEHTSGKKPAHKTKKQEAWARVNSKLVGHPVHTPKRPLFGAVPPGTAMHLLANHLAL
mmetsp:Transcript_109791/g.199957  ORF Transcript_109791/g.199957 Transcript_109791/m.199957 type:complete len:86 (+) Transcript_109791:84-341(+)